MKTENVIVEGRTIPLYDNTNYLGVSEVSRDIKIGFRKGFHSWKNYHFVIIDYDNRMTPRQITDQVISKIRKDS
jgi:hypothetical protein